MSGRSWALEQKQAGGEHRIDAPRIFAYAAFPGTNDYVKTIHTPDAAREWLAAVKDRGAEGVKFFGAPPAIMKAALEACRSLGLRSLFHPAQLPVGRMDALTVAQWAPTSSAQSQRP